MNVKSKHSSGKGADKQTNFWEEKKEKTYAYV